MAQQERESSRLNEPGKSDFKLDKYARQQNDEPAWLKKFVDRMYHKGVQRQADARLKAAKRVAEDYHRNLRQTRSPTRNTRRKERSPTRKQNQQRSMVDKRRLNEESAEKTTDTNEESVILLDAFVNRMYHGGLQRKANARLRALQKAESEFLLNNPRTPNINHKKRSPRRRVDKLPVHERLYQNALTETRHMRRCRTEGEERFQAENPGKPYVSLLTSEIKSNIEKGSSLDVHERLWAQAAVKKSSRTELYNARAHLSPEHTFKPRLLKPPKSFYIARRRHRRNLASSCIARQWLRYRDQKRFRMKQNAVRVIHWVCWRSPMRCRLRQERLRSLQERKRRALELEKNRVVRIMQAAVRHWYHEIKTAKMHQRESATVTIQRWARWRLDEKNKNLQKMLDLARRVKSCVVIQCATRRYYARLKVARKKIIREIKRQLESKNQRKQVELDIQRELREAKEGNLKFADFDVAGHDCVGMRVWIMWTETDNGDVWHSGRVIDFDSLCGKHEIEYADGDKMWHEMKRIEYVVVSNVDLDLRRELKRAKVSGLTFSDLNISGVHFVGMRVWVMWSETHNGDTWHNGSVTAYDVKSQKHKIEYLDGDELWCNISTIKHLVVLDKEVIKLEADLDRELREAKEGNLKFADFDVAGHDCVGMRVWIMWTETDNGDVWHSGRVIDFDSLCGKHEIEYADGDKMWHEMKRIEYVVVSNVDLDLEP